VDAKVTVDNPFSVVCSVYCNCTFPQNRKNDEAAYMQMLKLKRDLARAWYVCTCTYVCMHL